MAEIETAQRENNEEAVYVNNRVVPLSKNELILGGASNLVIVTIGFIFEIWIDATIGFDHSAIKNTSDLNNFGEYIAKIRTAQSLQLGVFVFVYPVFVWWYTAMIRVLKICFAEYHGSRTMFSFSYFLHVTFLYASAAVGILWQAFFWSIKEETTNTNLPATDLILLFMYRFEILLISLGIYFAAIMMIAFWMPFIYALYIDTNYKNNLKVYILPSCCTHCFGKTFLVSLAVLTLICSYLSVYSWSYDGFWSLSGGSQGFQIFTIFSGALSGLWLIWFGASANYDKFNDRVQFKQFI